MPVDASVISLELLILEFLTVKQQVTDVGKMKAETKTRLHKQLLKLQGMVSEAGKCCDDAAYLLQDIFEFDSLELKHGSVYNTMKIKLSRVSTGRFCDIITRSMSMFTSIKNFKGVSFVSEGNLFNEAEMDDELDIRDDEKNEEDEREERDIILTSLKNKPVLYADDHRLGQLVRMLLRYAIVLTKQGTEVQVKGKKN
jgi:hypothetical protein